MRAHATLPIAALALAELLVWAGLYYLFPALLLRWEGAFGWSRGTLTATFTLSLLIAAASAPLFGRLVDRGHGRQVLAGGAAAGALLLLALTWVESPWAFAVVWACIGLCLGACLYEPTFALVTRAREGAARDIALITLVAGFAGTLGFPAAAVLSDLGDWRFAAYAFAAAILVVAVPLFWWAAGRLGSGGASAPKVTRPVRGHLRTLHFWLLAASFPALALCHGIVIAHLLPILDERGVAQATALAAIAAIGPMQVVGRVLLLAVARRASSRALALSAFAAMAAAPLLLAVGGTSALLLFLFAGLQGMAMGATTILRPAIAADLLGRGAFGTLSGTLAVPYLAAAALAPMIGTVLWSVGGYDLVLVAMAALVALGAAAFLGALRRASGSG
ncbi:MAG: MFS transporter [Pseudomonadota bacterium]